jgi:hypothetical protein
MYKRFSSNFKLTVLNHSTNPQARECQYCGAALDNYGNCTNEKCGM